MIRFCCLALLAAAFSLLPAADLKPETAAAFDHYVKLTEDGFAQHQRYEDFLWLDHHPDEKRLAWLQQSFVRALQTLDQGKEIEVPDGEIQHWLGAVFLENKDTDADHMRGLLLNFAGYKDFFRQRIIDSKFNKIDGPQIDFFLRFYKKQFSTVVLNVDEHAVYNFIDHNRWAVACHSTHIGEAEHPGNKKKRDENRASEGEAGYLWRLNFYWRILEADNGCYIELEVISLGRPPSGRLSPGRYLTGFQSFPHDLTQYLIDSMVSLFPRRR